MRKGFLYRSTALLSFAFLLAMPATAQVYAKAKTLTVADGLSDNRVTCFYKDKTGFVWIGTKNGLNRYDGKRIAVFRPTAGNSLSNEVITDIDEDSQGRIWVATMNGLNSYDPKTARWECLLPKTVKADDDIPSNLVWEIEIDNRDRVWIASDVQAFCYYDIAAKKFTYYDWPAFVRSDARFATGGYNSVKRFRFKNENEVWIASNKALVLLHLPTKAFRYVAGTYRSDVADLRYEAATKKVFLVQEKGVLSVWDEAAQTWTETAPQPEPFPSTRFVLPSADETWLAAEGGLLRIADGKAYLTGHLPQLSGSLLPGGVQAVLHDRDGIRWVGTPNGVSIYDAAAPSLFLPLLPTSDKEAVNTTGGVYADERRGLYVVCATTESAVFVADKRSGEITKHKTDRSGKAFYKPVAVRPDAEGGLWLLTENHVYRYDDASKTFALFPTPNGEEPVVFRDMVQDVAGDYWFASFHKGLYCYSKREKRFFKPAAKGFENVITATALVSDAKHHSVWIGTFSLGFYRYNLRTKTLTAFLETDEHPEYAALNLVQDATQDGAGNVWAATQSGGLFRFSVLPNDSVAIAHFDMRTGLDENSFLSLCANDDSLLWAMSGKGITAFTASGHLLPPPNRGQGFNFSSYAPDIRLSHKIFWERENNRLLVGVGGGLLLHEVGSNGYDHPVPVVLTAATVNGDAASSLALNEALAHHQNNLSFEFASLYFGSSPDLVVEYKLDGEDSTWRLARNEWKADYQNLSPGAYRLAVRVRNAEGKVLGSATSAPLRIGAPFWQRWWARGLTVLLVAGVVYAVFRRRIGQVRKGAALRQQMAELESKALRAQMNPHFIFNSLNAIQELIVTENVEAAYDYLSKFSKLLRLVLNNSEKPMIPLADELTMLELYLQLESLRFRQSFSYRISVGKTLDAESVLVPPLLLQPFLENAVWHGLMLKEGEKRLLVRIEAQNGDVVCVVEDNGIGRERAAEIKAQKLGAAHFESKGLQLSRQRIALLQREGQSGAVKIEDLYEGGLASGTRVSVSLPVVQA